MNEQSMVGILLGPAAYRNIPSGRTGKEQLSWYAETAAEFGLVPCFVQLSALVPGRLRVPAYVPDGNGAFRFARVPFPRVIHNRAIHALPANVQRLNRLAHSGIHIFNLHNRYSKWQIHTLLMQDEAIRPHLPETAIATPASIYRLQQNHPALILKPAKGSVGRGIMRLALASNGKWELLLQRRTGRWHRICFSKRLPRILLRRIRRESYIVQQYLPLATYEGRPFDLRVSVQKNETGGWQITGVAVRVAQAGAFLTNVAQGASVVPLETVLSACPQLDPVQTEEAVSQFALQVAHQLDRHLPHLADLGLDIGLTEYGYPLFIEVNGRDQRYSFEEAGMYDIWKQTYRNPMAYAHYLLTQPKTT